MPTAAWWFSSEIEDVLKSMRNEQWATDRDSPLLMMEFQKLIEQKAFEFGGGKFVAPAQRMVDFTEG